MSWKVQLGIGILALLGVLMLVGFVKSVIYSLLPVVILLLLGYGAFRLYVATRGKAETPPQLPQATPPAVSARPTKDAATRLREIREEAARQQRQQQ
ncbi:hypothetical protein ACQP0C_28050 [Nocardia sp. CA-129566]|uniref:hypothetical protein n=1 Tax=Nocardia sp. CA-129566 TaxID=3239976 RepID=UPI003D984146